MNWDALESEADRNARVRHATNELLKRLQHEHDFNFPYPPIIPIEIVAPEEDAILIEVGILPLEKPTISANGIKRLVCQFFQISHEEMIGPRRHPGVLRPRMIAMYLTHRFCPHLSLPVMGRFFNRDHTSVLHAVNKVKRQISESDPICEHVRQLEEILSS